MFETKDPYLLLSLVNTKLRDEASSLDDLCKTYNLECKQIKERLEKVGYDYDQNTNQFVTK